MLFSLAGERAIWPEKAASFTWPARFGVTAEAVPWSVAGRTLVKLARKAAGRGRRIGA
jgi:hypothetical protein